MSLSRTFHHSVVEAEFRILFSRDTHNLRSEQLIKQQICRRLFQHVASQHKNTFKSKSSRGGRSLTANGNTALQGCSARRAFCPRMPPETGWEPAQRTGKDACVRLASICRIGSTKMAAASRFDFDDWPLPYLDKPQPSVKVRSPMPEKAVFA